MIISTSGSSIYTLTFLALSFRVGACVFVFLCKFSGALAFAICFGDRILLTGGKINYLWKIMNF